MPELFRWLCTSYWLKKLKAADLAWALIAPQKIEEIVDIERRYIGDRWRKWIPEFTILRQIVNVLTLSKSIVKLSLFRALYNLNAKNYT